LTPERDRRPGQEAATELISERPGSVTLEVADALRAYTPEEAALIVHYRKRADAMTPAQLAAWTEVAIRALNEVLHGSNAEAAVTMPATSAKDLELEAADAPDYRSERPPGAGVKVEIDEPVSQ
jgi:hypothetical protein